MTSLHSDGRWSARSTVHTPPRCGRERDTRESTRERVYPHRAATGAGARARSRTGDRAARPPDPGMIRSPVRSAGPMAGPPPALRGGRGAGAGLPVAGAAVSPTRPRRAAVVSRKTYARPAARVLAVRAASRTVGWSVVLTDFVVSSCSCDALISVDVVWLSV